MFEVTANDTTCDCPIAIEVDWIAARRTGKTILDNGGAGFRVLTAPKVPSYQFADGDSTRLVPAS